MLVDADALDPEPLSACIPPLVPADTVASPLFICILPSAPAVTEVSPLFTVTEPSETETLGVSDAEADADEELEALLELLAPHALRATTPATARERRAEVFLVIMCVVFLMMNYYSVPENFASQD